MTQSGSGARLDGRYDAVVVGAGNGGLAAALAMAAKGAKPLVLEQHNLPGGFATSFVRGRFEFDVSLHELSEVGPDDNKGGVRQFLEDEAGVNIDWVRVPEAYRVIVTDRGINARMPFGVEEFIQAVADAVPGSREPMTKYMELCQDISDMFAFLGRMSTTHNPKDLLQNLGEFLKSSDRPLADARDMAVKMGNFLRTLPYSADQVTRTFDLPEDAVQILYPYWCYLGIPMSRLPFAIWAGMVMSYLHLGAYVPRMRSQELTAAMESRIRELGGHVEYNTRVSRILVNKGRVTGVETAAGDVIQTENVIANASHSLVYSHLVYPQSEVPDAALKLCNARKHGGAGYVVYMGLDAPPDELGITDYGYFIADDMDTDAIYGALDKIQPMKMQATTCLNLTVPDCSPPGTTILCITILYDIHAWKDVQPKDYVRVKNQAARELIEQFERATGVDVFNHIEEIEVASPATFARYTGTFNGGIYGYEPDVWDFPLTRVLDAKNEEFIKGLDIAGGYGQLGHGYSPSLTSGRAAGLKCLENMGVKS